MKRSISILAILFAAAVTFGQCGLRSPRAGVSGWPQRQQKSTTTYKVYDQDDLGFDNKPVPHKSPSYYVKRDNQTGRTEVYKASEYGYSGEPTIYDKPVLVIESEESTGW